MQFKFNKIALTCTGVFILANTIVSCKFGGEVGGRADDGSAVQAQQPDTLNNFMDTLTLHHEHAFTLSPKVKNVLNVTFAWSEDPNCERVDYSTPISGKLAVDNTQTNTYLLSPEAYEFLNAQSGGYKGQKIRNVFKSYRIYMDVEDQDGKKTTELGQCYKIGQNLAAASSTEASVAWPKPDPCEGLNERFTPVTLAGRQWHSFSSFDACRSQFAITGLMESAFVTPLNNYQVPHGAGLYCSCNYISWDGEKLTACCEDGGGKWKNASLEYTKCTAGQAVENIKGKLRCVEFPMPGYNPSISVSAYSKYKTSPIRCEFRSPNSKTSDLSYTCQDDNFTAESQHFNADLCDDPNQLHLPIYGPQAGHLACKSTNNIIPKNSTTDEYLKVLLQQADTFIHCNTNGHCYLDFYSSTKPYTSMEFANAGELAKYVSDSQPMNADGDVVAKDSSARVKGYVYWGEITKDQFTMDEILNDPLTVLPGDNSCKLVNYFYTYASNYEIRLYSSIGHTRVITGGDNVNDHFAMKTDGNFCTYYQSGDEHNCATNTEYKPSLILNQYQVLHLEEYGNDNCALVSMRGTRRYQYTTPISDGGKASWQPYTSKIETAMKNAGISQYIGSTSVSVLGKNTQQALQAAVFNTSWPKDSIGSKNGNGLLTMITNDIKSDKSADAILYNSDQYYLFLQKAQKITGLKCPSPYTKYYWKNLTIGTCNETYTFACMENIDGGKRNILPEQYSCSNSTTS